MIVCRGPGEAALLDYFDIGSIRLAFLGVHLGFEGNLLALAEGLQPRLLYLRDMEHKLQMVHELQVHTLPLHDEEIYKCAIRMGFEGQQLIGQPSPFLTEYETVTRHVRELVTRILL